MNEQQLISFIEVARKQHFRLAAKSLRLTQPAVSAQIRTLEEELGTTLFYRTQVKLTPSGALFLPYAQQILDLIRDSREAVSEHEQKPFGPLTIGTTSCLSMAILPRLAKYFQTRHPDLPLRLLTLPTEQVIQQLNEGKIDAGIAYQTGQIPGHIETRTLFYDSFTLITAPSHPLAKSSYLSPGQIEQLPMISFAPTTTERGILDELLHQYRVHPQIVIELSSVEEIKQLVAEGYGVALVPTVSVDSGNQQLQRVRITPFDHSFPVLLYYPAKRYQSRSIRQLIDDISGVYPAEAE
ncbi:LysR family transcriptional regulator [Paenactinomyces guangxiensis]|uniref:LysR family transcriptional regulator n=1 Tax=Paenactinomyces guangxiensis TaxID=1490290 RepID=A0A7W1WN60_9BACL|nr:LysR family transcriptional regulator [Paenactinomyces guangxiensis]MBA4492881.1 LysR family transcriptional regulator [Paenactinomyces guangxiensis]MBH8590271.1 LysR family transcriptional regulator [Paenactinomyces guangxiensis]